jgi:hypothetical protein
MIRRMIMRNTCIQAAMPLARFPRHYLSQLPLADGLDGAR